MVSERRRGCSSALGARARYDEVGELQFGAYLGRAHRSLEYVRLANGAVKVEFTDGRPFIELDLGTGSWCDAYLCGDDRYEIATVVRSRNVVEEWWRVLGPTKDYEATTTLTRVWPRAPRP